MSVPLIWIVFPGVAAMLLALLARWQRVTILTGSLLALGLFLAAWWAPIGEEISLGAFTLQFDPVLDILGRRFQIEAGDRSVLLLIYGASAFWFLGAFVARVDRYFVPLGLGMAAALTGAFAVEPFLYAPLLIEMAVLASVPLLVSAGQPSGDGVLRYITFQSLGFPFLLFTSWILERLSGGQGGQEMQLQVLFLLTLGFLLMLGAFPFHSWITMIARESHPYAFGFLTFMLPLVVMLVGLNYLDRFAWMRADRIVFDGLAYIGAVMVLVGGLWAGFQENIGRMLGFAVMIEVGLSLLAASLVNNSPVIAPALGLFFGLTLPRAFCLAIWALAMVAFSRWTGVTNEGETSQPFELTFTHLSGAARSMPFASFGLLLAMLSLGGFPLLAGFPIRMALLSYTAMKSPWIAFLTLSGLFGMTLAGLRTLAVLLVHRDERNWTSLESWPERALLGLGGLVLIVIGLMPQFFTPFLAQMTSVFPNIVP